LICP